MAYTIEIRPLATMEILEAHDWYEAQQQGLGLKFIVALDVFFQHAFTQSFCVFFFTG